jgi:hypothetical protein
MRRSVGMLGRPRSFSAAKSKKAPERLYHELMHLNPSAARSLEEGLEETLTIHKLRVPDQLPRTLPCTNVIESTFSVVETVCRNVKRWHEGDHVERWVGSGLLVVEQQCRKVVGFRHVPLLLSVVTPSTTRRSRTRGQLLADLRPARLGHMDWLTDAQLAGTNTMSRK